MNDLLVFVAQIVKALAAYRLQRVAAKHFKLGNIALGQAAAEQAAAILDALEGGSHNG